MDKDAEILRLIEERRSTPKEEKQRLKDLSKRIKMHQIKQELRDSKTSKESLESSKAFETSLGSKQQRRKYSLRKKKNDKGEFITSRKGTADVFREFYKRLCEDNERDDFEHEMSDDRRILEITTEELQNAISKLKKGKSPDSNGIRAEDIKACDDETREW